MNALGSFIERVPRWSLFLAAAAIQIVLIAVMVFDRAGILRQGQEVKLQTRPVDPRDFLRGDYVVLSYDISELPSGALKDQPSKVRNPSVYVKLSPQADGFHHPVSVHAEPVNVSAPELLIKGKVKWGARCGTDYTLFCDRITVVYGLEKYFVPQGEGRDIESSRNQGKVAIVAAVTASGRAAIKRLLIDGKPVYDEPLF